MNKHALTIEKLFGQPEESNKQKSQQGLLEDRIQRLEEQVKELQKRIEDLREQGCFD